MPDAARTFSAQHAAADLTGTRLGSYEVLRLLGHGAMAEVYLAQQDSLKRQVALKVLRPDLARDATYVRRFHLEAQSAAQLVDGAIVQIYEVGSRGDLHYIAQEYVRGMTLGQLLARRGAPELQVALSILRQVASALAKAGQAGIVHRDIKPENILLSTTGEVKVADFGLARVINESTLNLTQEGLTLGTPLYMSPEQVEGNPLDPRSDIYSLGITAYHMLAGRAPFQGDTALAVAVQHIRTAPERLENLRPDLPAALCRIVHKMIAKSPGERHQSARELLDDLRSVDAVYDDRPNVQALNELSNLDQHDVTQRLSALMHSASAASRQVVQWRYAALLGLISLGAGMGLARATRPQPVLEVQASLPTVDLKATAQAQYDYAQRIDKEDGWESVYQFFPDDHELALQAKQQLARWYIEQDRFDDARKLFDEFAASGPDEERWRALGILGQALVYSVENKPQKVREKLRELRPLRQDLPVRESRQLISQVLGREGRDVPQEIRAEWQGFGPFTRNSQRRGGR